MPNVYAAAFEYAGLPEGVFQYLHLSHDQVAQVIGDTRVDYVAFTGSVEGGHAVQKAINERFIVGGLELGGKDPAYVRADATWPTRLKTWWTALSSIRSVVLRNRAHLCASGRL